jgi:hypothetical protein
MVDERAEVLADLLCRFHDRVGFRRPKGPACRIDDAHMKAGMEGIACNCHSGKPPVAVALEPRTAIHRDGRRFHTIAGQCSRCRTIFFW